MASIGARTASVCCSSRCIRAFGSRTARCSHRPAPALRSSRRAAVVGAEAEAAGAGVAGAGAPPVARAAPARRRALALLLRAGGKMITCAIFTNIVFLLIFGTVSLAANFILALILYVIAAINICYYYCVRNRIPFAAANL